ncbi:MAG TPA: carboxypeptidase-like regulatory domain-containing protein, partial [Niabella sp.]|nr:carboxypeptidase-like regulatory domain-containing protein [Niabella sp.]
MKKTNFKISFVEFLLFALFLLADNTCFSQTPQLKLRGTVLDSAGTGMQAVSVRAFLSNQAMLTDAEGKFTLNVSPNETLEFTYVGYLTQQRKISDLRPDANGEVFLTLVMVRDNRAMDEVVVVGFGTQRKKSLVSSVTNVKVEELKTSTG